MILAALTRHEPGGGFVPPGYARKSTLGFELVITGGGTGCRVHSLYKEKPGGQSGWVAPPALVPDMTRANNPPPLLACDNSAFVLGRSKPSVGESAERQHETAGRKQGAFVELMSEYHAIADDPDAGAFVEWHRLGMPGLEEQLGALPTHAAKRLDLDLIAIRTEHATIRIHENPMAQRFWAERAAAAKSSGDARVCLVCGRLRPAVDTLPQALAGRWIPGTDTAQVALASVNFASAARGASGSGLKSAPVCAACAGRAVAAFNDLAASSEHSYRLGDGTAAIWWATDSRADRLMTLLAGADPAQVRDLFASVHHGVEAGSPRGQLYLLVFSGNVARLVIRRWLPLELTGLETNLIRWFDDVEVADRGRPFRTPLAMARSLGPFPVGDRSESSPDGCFEELLLAAFTGESPPRAYLRQAVARAVAEVGRLDDGWLPRQRAWDRLAIIRLILNRAATDKEKTMAAQLDEDRADSPYLSGRIFALSQNLQRAALGDVNSSIVDRFFARAVQHPASVDSVLVTLQNQHRAALTRKGSGGLANVLDSQIGRLRSRMGDAPGRMSVEQQAAWIAGFYQQRQALFDAIEERKRNIHTSRDDAGANPEEG